MFIYWITLVTSEDSDLAINVAVEKNSPHVSAVQHNKDLFLTSQSEVCWEALLYEMTQALNLFHTIFLPFSPSPNQAHQ